MARPDPRTRPFRFGVGTAAGTPHSHRHWTEHVRRIEDLGFATLQVADHYSPAPDRRVRDGP